MRLTRFLLGVRRRRRRRSLRSSKSPASKNSLSRKGFGSRTRCRTCSCYRRLSPNYFSTSARPHGDFEYEYDAFRWTGGEEHIATWKKPDADWQFWFCRTCGSSLPGVNDPSRMFVPAGLIAEGGEDLELTHHIWVDSKAGWDEIGDAGHGSSR